MQTPTSPYSVGPVETWWVLALAGVINVLFGIAAIAWPGMTLVVLVWLFGIYAIIYGIVELINMFRAIGAHHTWWTHLLLGIFSIIAGLVVVAWPGATSVFLAYVIAIWAIAIGITEIIGAFTMGNFLLAVLGVISIVFGFILFANPVAGAVALVLVIGVFAIVRGIILIVEAIRGPSQPATA